MCAWVGEGGLGWVWIGWVGTGEENVLVDGGDQEFYLS